MSQLKLLAAEFRDFMVKQNALALAVGVVIGAAVGKVVSGVVDDLFMPLIGLLMPGKQSWREWQYSLNGDNALKLGDLLGRIIDFLIVALVIFAVVKIFLTEKPKAPTTKACAQCLELIPLAALRCRACTSLVS